eukprot:c7836_g1_i1.p1 GENE.c7836_g1_i1~~c7836_g1_i1.p1  ORF type:complete len:579 (+),score=151.73 c7836_g1_i1:50-1786(+)
MLDFRSADVHSPSDLVRLKWVQNLPEIAVRAGTINTNNILLPLIDGLTDDDTHVCVALAAQIAEIVPYFDPQDVVGLFGPLEKLLCMDSYEIRDQSVQSISRILLSLPEDEVERNGVPLLNRLAKHIYWAPRASAATLLSIFYRRIRDRSGICKLFTTLSTDSSALVRKAIAQSAHNFAASLDLSTLQTTFSPAFKSLLEDESEPVQLAAVENFAEVARQFNVISGGVPEYFHILFKKWMSEKSMRLRYAIVGQFTAICTHVKVTTDDIQIMELFSKFLVAPRMSDEGLQTRINAINQLPKLSNLLLPETRWQLLLPMLNAQKSDRSIQFRVALTVATIELIEQCDEEEISLTGLRELFIHLLKDEAAEVRLQAISGFQAYNKKLDYEIFCKDILPLMFDMTTDNEWRVRVAIVEYIPDIGRQLGELFFSNELIDLLFIWLCDPVHSMRVATVNVIGELCGMFGTDWSDTTIVGRLVTLMGHCNYLHRIVGLLTVQAIIEFISTDKLSQVLLPKVLELCQDKVPNVRIVVCNTLAKLILVYSPATSAVRAAVTKWIEESDPEVKGYVARVLDMTRGAE